MVRKGEASISTQNDQMDTVGQIISKKRESLGLLPRQVVLYIDIDQAILSKVERNKCKPTKDDIV